jgi:hypothetical protein
MGRAALCLKADALGRCASEWQSSSGGETTCVAAGLAALLVRRQGAAHGILLSLPQIKCAACFAQLSVHQGHKQQQLLMLL